MTLAVIDLQGFSGPRISDGVAAAIREHGDAARGAVVGLATEGWRGWAIVGDVDDEWPVDWGWGAYPSQITMGRTDRDHERAKEAGMPHPAKRSYETSMARGAAVLAEERVTA